MRTFAVSGYVFARRWGDARRAPSEGVAPRFNLQRRRPETMMACGVGWDILCRFECDCVPAVQSWNYLREKTVRATAACIASRPVTPSVAALAYRRPMMINHSRPRAAIKPAQVDLTMLPSLGTTPPLAKNWHIEACCGHDDASVRASRPFHPRNACLKSARQSCYDKLEMHSSDVTQLAYPFMCFSGLTRCARA